MGRLERAFGSMGNASNGLEESAILEIPMRSLRRRLLRYVGDFGRCKFRAGSDGSTNSHLEV